MVAPAPDLVQVTDELRGQLSPHAADLSMVRLTTSVLWDWIAKIMQDTTRVPDKLLVGAVVNLAIVEEVFLGGQSQSRPPASRHRKTRTHGSALERLCRKCKVAAHTTPQRHGRCWTPASAFSKTLRQPYDWSTVMFKGLRGYQKASRSERRQTSPRRRCTASHTCRACSADGTRRRGESRRA